MDMDTFWFYHTELQRVQILFKWYASLNGMKKILILDINPPHEWGEGGGMVYFFLIERFELFVLFSFTVNEEKMEL